MANITRAGLSKGGTIDGNLTLSGNITMGDDTSIGISDSDERIEFDGAGDISLLGANVGIGDTTPSYKLDVDGTFRTTGAATFDSTIDSGAIASTADINAAGYIKADGLYNNLDTQADKTLTTAGWLEQSSQGTTAASTTYEIFNIKSDEGWQWKYAEVSVTMGVYTGGYLSFSGTVFLSSGTSTSLTASNTPQYNLEQFSHAINQGELSVYDDDGVIRVYFTTGTWGSTQILTVRAKIHHTKDVTYNLFSTGEDGIQQGNVITPTNIFAKQVGKVGIGTANPSGHLEIYNSDNTTYDVSQTDSQRDEGTSLVLYNPSTTTNSFAQLVFRNRNSGTGAVRIAGISKGADDSDLAISNDENDIIYIDGSTERVGIGTASPAHKLDVDGGIVEQGGVLKENLLTNSGFDIWSQSTLENATGTKLHPENNCTDPDSDTDSTTGWSSHNGGTLSSEESVAGFSGSVLKVLDTAGADGSAYFSETTVVGKLYKLVFTQKNGDNRGFVTVGQNVSDYDGDVYEVLDNTSATAYSIVFEASFTTTYVTLGSLDDYDYCYFNDVSLYEVTPGIMGNDYKGPDGWLTHDTSNIDVYRQHTDGATEAVTKLGSFYSLKCVTSTGASNIKYPGVVDGLWGRVQPTWYSRFKGRTVTFGCWVKCHAPSQANVEIWFEGGAGGSTTTSSAQNTGTGWEWLEVTKTVDGDIGDSNPAAAGFQVGIIFAGGSGDQYVSQPILVFGSSIGEGNYTKPINEIISIEETIWLDGFLAADIAGVSGGGATRYGSGHHIINLEVATQGKLSKDIKMIDLHTAAKDTGSGGGAAAGFRWHTEAAGNGHNVYSCVMGGVASDTWAYGNTGLMPCTYEGDIWVYIYASGSGTFTSSGVNVNSVMLR